MKKFLIIIFTVFAVVIAGLFVYLQFFDANQYRGILVEKASEALGRAVTIDDINLTVALDKGVSLKLSGVAVADGPHFSDAPLLSAESVWLNVDVKRLISGQNLKVNSFKISDASINIRQHISDELRAITIDHFDFQAANIADGSAFPFNGALMALSEKQNITFNGKARVDSAAKQLSLTDVNLRSDLSTIAMDQLTQVVPQVKDLGVTDNLQGVIDLNLEELIVDDQTMPAVNMKGSFKNGSITLKELGVPIKEINADIGLADDVLTLKNIAARIYSGSVGGDVRLINIFQNPLVQVNVKCEQLLTEDLLDGKGLPVDLRGVMRAEVELAGLLAEIPAGLKGNVSFTMDEARIVDLNVLDVVFSHISFVPNLAEKVSGNLPGKYKEKLDVKDTELKIVYAEGKLVAGDLNYMVNVEADEFLAYLTGVFQLNQTIDNTTHVYIPKDLSDSLIQSVEELSALLDNQGRIHIPFKQYSGPVDRIEILPDLGQVGRRVIEQKGKQELRDAIYKALDIDTPSQNPSDKNTQPKQEKPIEQQLLDGLLNEIPLFK